MLSKVGEPEMTIVLASITRDSNTIIMSSDKMLTQSDFTHHFEHDSVKIVPIGYYLVGYAGTTVFADDIIGHGYDTNKPIDEFVKDVAEFYIRYRLSIAGRIILESQGIDLGDYNSNIANYPPTLQQYVHRELKEFDLGVQLLICGFKDGEPKIYRIGRYGIYQSYHAIGFHAIGIGETHVMNYYIVNQFRFDMPLKEAVYFAFRAKKSAELAAGVGELTDVYIFKHGEKPKLHNEDDPLLKEMNKLCEYHVKRSDSLYSKSILPRIDALPMS